MTDNEKILEIVNKYIKNNSIDRSNELIDCCKEIADWKNKQLEIEKQSLIKKACEWIKENDYDYLKCDGVMEPYYIETSKLIEDFKKAMEK